MNMNRLVDDGGAIEYDESFGFLDNTKVIEWFEDNFGQNVMFKSILEESKGNFEFLSRFIGFFMGDKTLPLTYDPFFKKIFSVDDHKDRLESLISEIIGEPVEIIDLLSPEDMIIKGDSILIMDIVVKLANEDIVNVEIQRIPYSFSEKRMSCYSSDLMLRQYRKLKAIKGKNFTYKDIKNVYTIIMFEKSLESYKTTVSKEDEGTYIFKGSMKLEPEAVFDFPQKLLIICLDVFSDSRYSRSINKLNGWLSLLVTDNVSDVDKVINDYPWLREVYDEMAVLKSSGDEILGMFSEELRIMDINTRDLMIDMAMQETEKYKNQTAEYKKEIAEYKKEIVECEKDIAEYKKEIVECEKDIAEYKSNIAEYKSNIAEYESNIAEYESNIAEYESNIAEYEKDIQNYKNNEIVFQQQLSDKDERIKELEMLLARK